MAKSRQAGVGPVPKPPAGAPSGDLYNDLPSKGYLVEAGNLGLKVFGGYVVEEYDPNLRGRRGAQIYREMADSDPTVGAILFVLDQVISKLEWHWKPKDQTLMSLAAAEFFETLADDMEHTWADFIRDAMTSLPHGFAPMEIVLKKRDGKQSDKRFSSEYEDGMFGIRKIALRQQETLLRWIFDPDNNDILGMVQMPWTGGIRMIPRDKLCLFRVRPRANNPDGRSILRSAYRPWYFKKRIEELEGIGIERDLAGFPVMRVPSEIAAAQNNPAASAADKALLQSYLNIVKNIKRNSQEGLLLPSDTDEHGKYIYDLVLLSASGSRQFNTNETIARWDQKIATSVMADFLLMGHQTRGGNQALGSSKIEMFFAAVSGLVKMFVDTINKDLVPLICDLNGIPVENRPSCYTDKPEQVDLGRLGSYVNALAASGMVLFPDEDLEDYLRRVAGLPIKSDETEMKHEAIKASGAPMGPGTGGEAQPGQIPGGQGMFGSAGPGGGNGAPTPNWSIDGDPDGGVGNEAGGNDAGL